MIDTGNVNHSKISNGDSFEIGRLGRLSPADAFNGMIDDLRVYSHALSADEVLRLYNAFAAPIPEPGTIGLLIVAFGGIAARRSRRAV